MLKIIFDTVTYLITIFIAIFGAISLVTMLMGSPQWKKKPQCPGIRMALIVKNAEDVIEGTVRDIILGDFAGKTMTDGILTVIDMGSTDSTSDILRKLRYEYGKLDIITSDEKEKFFELFS
jgi:hypothetical protein